MTLAWDVKTGSAGTGTLGATHTPSGTPVGVCALVMTDATTPQLTSLTYGGVAMEECPGSPNIHATGEPGCVSAFYLSAPDIPAGAQAWELLVSGSAEKHIELFTLTGNGVMTVEAFDASINSDALVDPSGTIVAGPGVNCFAVIGFHSGIDQIANITPLAGWTNVGEFDYGTTTSAVYRLTSNHASGGSLDYGWTQLSNDAVALAYMFTDVPSQEAPGAIVGLSVISQSLSTFGNTAQQSTYAVGTVTPTANEQIFIAILNSKGTTPDTPTYAANGLTWTQRGTVLFDSSLKRLTVLQALTGASPSSGTGTISFGGATQTGCIWCVFRMNGLKLTGTLGVDAIVQVVTNAGTGTTASATLAAFAATINATLFISAWNTGGTVAQEAGYTELGDFPLGTPPQKMQVEWLEGVDLSPTAVSGGSGNWGAIAVELAAVPGRTSKNTRSHPLGVALGIGLGIGGGV